jgi:hypothetical protein
MQFTYPSAIANTTLWLALLGVITSVFTATLNLVLPIIRPKGIEKLSDRTNRLRPHNVWESNLYEIRKRGQSKD